MKTIEEWMGEMRWNALHTKELKRSLRAFAREVEKRTKESVWNDVRDMLKELGENAFGREIIKKTIKQTEINIP